MLRAELRSMNHKALKPPVVAEMTLTCQAADGGDRGLSTPSGDPKIAKLSNKYGNYKIRSLNFKGAAANLRLAELSEKRMHQPIAVDTPRPKRNIRRR